MASDLKYLLQADDHIAVRFVVVFPSMRVSKKVPPEQSAIMSFRAKQIVILSEVEESTSDRQ